MLNAPYTDPSVVFMPLFALFCLFLFFQGHPKYSRSSIRIVLLLILCGWVWQRVLPSPDPTCLREHWQNQGRAVMY